MQDIVERLTVAQLVKKFPGTIKFITMLKTPSLEPILIQFNPFHSWTSYFSKFHFSIILLDLQLSLFQCGIQTRNFYTFMNSLMSAIGFAYIILLVLITLTI